MRQQACTAHVKREEKVLFKFFSRDKTKQGGDSESYYVAIKSIESTSSVKSLIATEEYAGLKSIVSFTEEFLNRKKVAQQWQQEMTKQD